MMPRIPLALSGWRPSRLTWPCSRLDSRALSRQLGRSRCSTRLRVGEGIKFWTDWCAVVVRLHNTRRSGARFVLMGGTYHVGGSSRCGPTLARRSTSEENSNHMINFRLLIVSLLAAVGVAAVPLVT